MCLPCAFVLLLKIMLQETAQAEIEAPLLAIDPPWVEFLTGDRITLTCNAGRELRSTKYIWSINDHGDIPGNSTYIIGTAKRNDSGRYKCKATSSTPTSNASYSNTILVNITSPDSFVTFEVTPENLWVDQSLGLRCNFSYLLKNELIYTFYRKGYKLTEIHSWNNSVSFEVEHVTLEHEGQYRCKVYFASHPNGPIRSSGYKSVSVRESPVRLDVEPKTQRDGDTIVLSCLYTGSDMSGSRRCYFYRNNSPVNSEPVTPGVHRIQQATVMDSGRYHCVIHINGVNHKSPRVEITVKRIPVSDAQLQISPGNGTVREGINLTLTCSVTEGSTPISYDWYRGEMYIHKENSSCREVTYTIYHFNESIGGNYSCSASNKVEGKGFTLHSRAVEVIAEVPVSCPSLRLDSNSTLVAIGDRVTLSCKSQRGTPPIHYLFYRGHHLLANITAIDSGTGHLTFAVQSKGEGGMYSCGAANGIADVANCSETVTLTVAVPLSGSLVLICMLTVASIFVLALLILIIVCKTRHTKKEDTDNFSQTGDRTRRRSPRHNSDTPAENSASRGDEIVYAVLQPKTNTDGRNGNGARRTPKPSASSDYYVTYAPLNHLQMERNREPRPREDEGSCSQSTGIYQNFRRQ